MTDNDRKAVLDQEKKVGFWNRILRRKRISDEDYVRIEDETTAPPDLPIHYTDSRRIIFSGLLIVGVFFGLGGLWISLAEISGAVIANGEVRVDTERKTVQHLEGGIVREILVRNGDVVDAGQPLIILDSSRVVAATDQLRLQIMATRLDEARLQAEKELSAAVSWPAAIEGVSKEQYDDLLDSVKKVFSSGRQALVTQTDLLRKQIDQLTEQDRSLAARQQAEEQIIATLQEELDAKMVLFEEQYIDKTRILELRRAIAEHQGLKAQLQGSQAELREKVAEFQLRISGLETEYRQKASAQQSEVQQRFFDLQQQLMPLVDARERLSVTAPVAGEVVALQVHSRGGVISPGQPLLDIVPKDSPLIVECQIMVKDITHLYKGQPADVQLLAFNQRTTPKVEGKVVYISADRLLQKTPYGEQPAYIVHIELDKQQLYDNDLYLTAGMPAAVFIRTEPRTVLDYVIEPLKENFDRALREN
ncbi:HlyD family type I secretion periplasmic adaptor subunit [Trichloromonas sp.]|uniref:HlyD family type I secretion periplasmic adaptor subunit n=1 Tax=Trichloromonas sp. TaxID=3069249 RepID=UPI002A4186C2|nr:HlyD family type I secretion periplasmic adaptor subunit [Trichloromonas sp.]